MRFGLLVLLIVLLPATTLAGAWPRAQGDWFVGLSYTARGDTTSLGTPAFALSGSGSLYLEYGATAKLTFGLDATRADTGDYSALAFARYPVVTGLVPGKLAVRGGIGMHDTAAGTEQFVQLGAHWGKGMETGYGPGWLSLDTQLDYRLTTGDTVAKADLTLGVKPNDRTKLMLRLQSGAYPGSDPYLRIAPSVARKTGDRQHVVLGVELDLIGGSNAGLTLGTWLAF